MERGSQEFTFVAPEKRIPIYFLAVASNGATDIGGHVSVLVDSSNELVSHRDHLINRATAARDELKARVSVMNQLQARAQAQQQLLAQRQEMIYRLNADVTERDRDRSTLDEIIGQ